jgi:hypothetical protein
MLMRDLDAIREQQKKEEGRVILQIIPLIKQDYPRLCGAFADITNVYRIVDEEGQKIRDHLEVTVLHERSHRLWRNSVSKSIFF